MQIHQIKPNHTYKDKKRVGRGGKKGTYSGRGIKGQKARAGRKMVPIIREIIKKYPKLRGYRRITLKKEMMPIVNLKDIELKFKEGEIINPHSLFEKRLIEKVRGKIPEEVKILAKGEITKKFIIENCKLSKKAKEIVEKAGGKVKS